jgi:hypothetical protein
VRVSAIALVVLIGGLSPFPPATTGAVVEPGGCVRLAAVQGIVFSAGRYPNVRRHFRGAVRRGWPRQLVLNRPGADARRERLLRDIPTRDAFDRDEYPQRSAEGEVEDLSVDGGRVAGGRMSALCRARRTARTARRLAAS